jgi:hypothetical protein
MRAAAFLVVLVLVIWLVGTLATGDAMGGVRAVLYAVGEGLRPMGETR